VPSRKGAGDAAAIRALDDLACVGTRLDPRWRNGLPYDATHVPGAGLRRGPGWSHEVRYHRTVAALIEASNVRIDVAGTPAIDGLSLRSTGERVLVIGAASALFTAAAGMRAIARGEMRVEGVAPVEAMRMGIAAGAPLDPPMPSRWTVRQYVAWSARLAGQGRVTAGALATDALARLELSSLADTKLGDAPSVVRRGAVLAAALATGAATVLVEDPLAALPPELAASLAAVVARALADRRVAFFAARVPLGSSIALAADEAIVVEGAAVAMQGAPAQIAASDRAFALRVLGNVRAFADAVEARGARLLAGNRDVSPASVSVELGVLRTSDLLRIAAATNVVVLDLHPLMGAFA
jgi:ABC-type multidrug transport system ATPase subunit